MKAISPRYGIDGHEFLRSFVTASIPLFSLAAALIYYDWLGSFSTIVGVIIGLAATIMLFLSVVMITYAYSGKYRMRDFMLSQLSLSGDENMLDVGTGRGLLAIGVSKQLSNGKAIGIDIWSAADLSGNSQAAAERNAQ